MSCKAYAGRRLTACELLGNEKLTASEIIDLLSHMPLDANRSPAARKGGNASDVWDAAHARMGLGEKIEASKEKHADLWDRAIAAIGGAQ